MSSSNHTNGKRKLWNVDTDFVSTPIFQNTLPGAPSGPFFKTVPFDSFDKFATYHVSSLEKSYAWQPHFIEAGVKIDLVDQESFLIPNNVPSIEPIDMKYIQASNDSSNRSKQRRAMLVKEDNEKPWWLRNTVYLENNLYNQPLAKSKALETDLQISRTEDPLSVQFIDNSFEKIKKLDSILIKAKKDKLGKKGPDVKMEWAIPILPEPSLYENPLVPIRFDEDIEELVSKKNQAEDLEMDVLYSIISNLRERMTSVENLHINDKSFNASLIAPPISTPRDVSTEGVPYTWVADFKMDFSTLSQGGNDEFLMKMDSSFSSQTSMNQKSVEYWPVKSRIDMRKLPVDEWIPHEAKIFRRKEVKNKTSNNKSLSSSSELSVSLKL